MTRLPHRYAPFLYGVIQVAITTAVASAVGVYHSGPLGAAALARCAGLWLAAWLLVISPLVHRLVAAITREAPRRCP